ncbi:MAG: hypothetical protein SGI90_06125 [Candidatus Eisenbacteria bacterium]|nr:hypothetical protein [Candidatus Eisenbacteria bacterium]
MTRSLTSKQRAVGPAVLLALLMSLTLIPGAGFGKPPAPANFLTPSLEALANALADSMEARCAAGFVRILEARGNDIRIDRGSSGGLRPFTRVTLSRPGAPAWKAEVESLTKEATWLRPAVPSTPGPEVGTTARIRLDIGRLALSQPTPGNAAQADIGLALAWHDRLASFAAARPGFEIVRLPNYPDSAEWREVARAAGADASVQTDIRIDANGWNVELRMASVRRGHSLGTIRGHAPAQRLGVIDAARATEQASHEPPPGLRTGLATSALDGPVLDIMSRRWLWSDAQVIFDDRIEAWSVTPDGLSPGSVIDLSTIWPAVTPTRWPVSEIIAVNTFYDMTGEEARVNYSLCSNQRPRYLTINIEKRVPDSLNLVESDGPLDRLTASVGGCFRELDRVAIPAGFAIEPTMPQTAIARLALEEILRDQSGRVLRTESGQFRRKKVAVLYHDEATASLWLSSPGAAMKLPGAFGVEMDGYRAGQAGPPGFLVTGGVLPGEADNVEWWVFTEGRCERRWVGPALDGSVTSILCGDRDGDERDDLILGIVRAEGDGYRSRLHLYSSRPLGRVTP